MTQDLLNRYDALCAEILHNFCQKQEADAEPSPWVSDIPGTTALVADYFLDFGDILADLRLEAPKGEIFRWWDHNADCLNLGITEQPNYRTWLKGNHGMTPEAIDRVREAKAKVEQAKQALENIIEDEARKSNHPY